MSSAEGFTKLHSGCLMGLQTHLRLDWGRIHFQVHWPCCWNSVSFCVGLRASGSCWLLPSSCLRLLEATISCCDHMTWQPPFLAREGATDYLRDGLCNLIPHDHIYPVAFAMFSWLEWVKVMPTLKNRGCKRVWTPDGGVFGSHLFLLSNFYWSIVALQCCVSFYCIAKWISHTYTYFPSFLDSPPI